MKRAVFPIVLSCCLPLFATGAQANLLTNGDFETGDLSGWSHAGDVRLAFANSAASAAGMVNAYALLGLGTTTGTSTLSQQFSVTGIPAIAVSFDWFFVYWDNSPTVNDVFLSLLATDGTAAATISMQELSTGGTPLLNGLSGHFANTYDISSFTANNATVSFQLVESGDPPLLTGTASIAGIDNVSVEPVPEPATLSLLASGGLLLAAARRRQRRRR
ncbi:MAG: PEP-CTERM sorting domain-containing protein [Thermodesulfobacteriota bacterium]